MSEQQQPDPETVELAPSGDAAFASLMDALAPEPEGEAPGTQGGEGAGGAAAGAPAGGGGDAAAGTPTAGDEGAGGAAGTGAAPGDGKSGAGGDAPQGGDGAAAGPAAGDAAGPDAGAAGDAGAVEAAVFLPKLGELSTKLEENTQNAYRAEALAEVREEHENYFVALEKHPRLLVGTQVPRIGGEGMETLKDTNDAREWQEAVKSILGEEVVSRASVKLDENRDFLNTAHASIDLFKNNPDLIPGTKGFDRDLADRFATFAQPYELRVDGKLQGYSVPVQPIIDQLRQQVAKERESAPAAASPAAGTPASAGGASTPPPADPPQAGVQSKAGSGDSKEDFSTLWGTIGLPDLTL